MSYLDIDKEVMDRKANSLMRIPEVAEHLSLSKGKVWQLVYSGEIPSIKIDKSRRVAWGALQSWLEKKIFIAEGREK